MLTDPGKSKELVEAAIKKAPTLGLAHITLAEFLRTEGDYEAADKHYTKGLGLLDGAGQPDEIALSSFGPLPVTRDEIAGVALAQHGFVLMMLAKAVSTTGDQAKEKALLDRSRIQLRAALRREPDEMHRSMAEKLLGMFKYSDDDG